MGVQTTWPPDCYLRAQRDFLLGEKPGVGPNSSHALAKVLCGRAHRIAKSLLLCRVVFVVCEMAEVHCGTHGAGTKFVQKVLERVSD